jgi:hypothetical protein
MKAFISVSFGVLFLQCGCERKENTQREPKRETHSAEPTTSKRITRKPPATKKFDHSAPKDILLLSGDDRKVLIKQLSEETASKDHTSLSEGFNSVYLSASENLSGGALLSTKLAFISVILDNPESAPSLIGGLPSGELRSGCVGSIFVTPHSIEFIKKTYSSLPESADKTRLGGILVQTTYFRNGIDSALDAIRSLDSATDRNESLRNLGIQIYDVWMKNGSDASMEDKQKIIEFAIQNKAEDMIVILSAIK